MTKSKFGKDMLDLSLVMIVKNSGYKIENAIRSVSELCREIVVCDTGSDDDTPIIASKLGANIYFKKWTDDFSEARNFALKHTNSKWIFILDDDEEISEINKDELSELMNNNKIGGIQVNIKNITDEGKTTTSHKYTRIFRNDKRIRFEGKIHEQIRPSIDEAGYDIACSSIEIMHYGYSEINEEKNERNKRIINKEIEDDPKDDYKKYHLALTEFADENHEKVISIYNEINNSKQLSELQSANLRLKAAQSYLKKDTHEKVIELTEKKINDINLEGFRQFIRAASMMHLGRFNDALVCYSSKECMQSEMTDKNIIKEATQLIKKVLH
jgi:glycosyltransferase involved in cell wall biosynthesis